MSFTSIDAVAAHYPGFQRGVSGQNPSDDQIQAWIDNQGARALREAVPLFVYEIAAESTSRFVVSYERTVSRFHDGAFVEAPHRLNLGDSIQLELRAGLRKIHCTAVVRNIGPDGNGVEFVHMKDEDRERLRKLIQRRLQF